MLVMERVRVIGTASGFVGESVSPLLTVHGYAAVGYGSAAGAVAVAVDHLVLS